MNIVAELKSLGGHTDHVSSSEYNPELKWSDQSQAAWFDAMPNGSEKCEQYPLTLNVAPAANTEGTGDTTVTGNAEDTSHAEGTEVTGALGDAKSMDDAVFCWG